MISPPQRLPNGVAAPSVAFNESGTMAITGSLFMCVCRKSLFDLRVYTQAFEIPPDGSF